MGNNLIPGEDKQEPLHPAFHRLAEICRRIDFGVIEELRIQDGLPVFLEVEVGTALAAKVKQKHKLTKPE